MPIAVDESRYPVVTMTFPELPSDEDIQDFIAVNLRLLAKKERHATVVDMRPIAEAAPQQRRMTADYVRQNYAALQQWRAGVAFVSSSRFTRGIVAAVMWLQRPPYEWAVVASVEAGIAWCEARLR
ncbi:MAG: hypothetical protein IT381_09455 [Deltaproteobacteria bacterium]|nr:hypothetical protein [Deltaproteobacteria bacterium]